jgi:peptidoglycan/LPS O-acetylase OafA/YrhL
MQDILRFILALAVLLFHLKHFAERTALTSTPDTFEPPLSWLLEPVYAYGYHAVTVFFFLSGFMLASTLVTDHAFNPKRFMAKRLARIYPAHFLSLLYMATLSLGISSMTEFSLFITYNDDIPNFLASLFLLNGLGIMRDVSFNLPSWSLSVELLCYVTFALVVETYRQNLGKVFALFMIAGGIVSSSGLGPNVGNVGNGLTFFFGGACFAILFLKRPLFLSKASLLTAIITAALSLYSLALSLDVNLGLQKLIWVLVTFPLGITAIHYIDLTIEKHFNSNRPFSYLGLMSFSIYIWHFPVQATMFYIIVGLGYATDTWFNDELLLAIYIGLTLVVSHISLNTVERLGSRLIKKIPITS